MRFARKLGKMVSGDALLSARRHTRIFLRDLIHPPTRSVPEIIAQMKADGFDRVKEKWQHVTEPVEGWPKYLQLEQWIPINLQRLRELELDQVGPRHILDLGSGAGFFLYINKLLGHSVLGLDVDDVPMFRDSVEVLGVPRLLCRIERFTPLPPLPHAYDVITGYLICFNNHKSENVWGPAEWDYFLDDLQTRLAPGGRVQFELNREFNGEPYTPQLRELFEKRGGFVDGFRVQFTRDQLWQTSTAASGPESRRRVAGARPPLAQAHVR